MSEGLPRVQSSSTNVPHAVTMAYLPGRVAKWLELDRIKPVNNDLAEGISFFDLMLAVHQNAFRGMSGREDLNSSRKD